jgi:hypothetical protein
MITDNFQGSADIELQANEIKVPYSFTFTVCSSATANDGHLPYGTNIASVVVYPYTVAGVAAPALISGTPTVMSNVVTVKLNWPGTAGTYKLTFVATLDNADATKIETDFKRIQAVNR